MGELSGLVKSLNCRQFQIPSLDGILHDWPRKTNPGYEALRTIISTDFKQMVEDPRKLAKLARDDYALCGAGMYMNADLEGLHIMTLLTTWLFFLDDKVDNKDGELFCDTTGFLGLAQEAFNYVAFTLGLNDGYEEPEGGLDTFVSLFKDVGIKLRELSLENRRFFLEDFNFYLRSLIQEQREAQQGKVRSFDEYMSLRRGTVCMYTICAATEIASGAQLPVGVVSTSRMLPLWNEIRDLMIFINDLYSLKNELYSENGASLVTLLLEKDDVTEALHIIRDRITECKVRFDSQADSVLALFPDEIHTNLNQYFDSLRGLVTGYHTWCLTTTRYGLRPYVNGDGSVLVDV